MTELQLFQALVSAGALGIIAYLFIAGSLVSQKTVDKLMQAQANHISDLKKVMEERLDKMIGILEEIRINGAMSKKKRK